MNNVNMILQDWKKNISCYNFLKDNIGKDISFSVKDKNCLSLGLAKYDYLTRYQQCFDCKKTSSFLQDPLMLDNDEIEIKFGKYKGEKIIFNRYNYEFFDISVGKKQKNINKYINQEINNFIINHYKENIYYYENRNKYLNLSIINTIIKRIAQAKNFPTPVKFLHFYICRDKIILLRFKYDIEHIKDLLTNPLFVKHLSPVSKKKKTNYLTSNIIYDIIKQIIIYFLFYEKFNFCHNEASIKYLKINCELNNFSFEDKEIISPIKVFLLPSPYSAISIYDSILDRWARFSYYRYEDRNPTNLVESWFVDWDGIQKKEKKISSYSLDDFEAGKIIYYYLGCQADKFLYFRRNMGSDIFYKSFDIICLLTSLMIENYIFVTVKNDRKLYKLWSSLWIKEELEDLEKDISQCKNNDFDNVFKIIRRYHLRVDALEYLSTFL